MIGKKNLYGRRLSRPLSAHKKNLMSGLLLAISVPAEKMETARALAPSALFEHPKQAYWMEIGFGNGEHLIALLEQYPDVGFLAAEPFINGMANFLSALSGTGKAAHVRVLMDDAMGLVSALMDRSLERIYVLNPDPWPKKRHHKRRIIQQESLAEFHRVLKPGGMLVLATDVDDLAGWMVTETMRHGGFDWQAERAADWQNPPEWWSKTTRYAEKGAKAGRRQSYLIFEKIEK